MESSGSTKRTPIACPKCGGRTTIPIVYGMPSRELSEDAARGTIRLGGCVVGPSMPDGYCPACESAFLRDDA